MTIEEQLRDLIIKHSGSVNRFANECGLSQSTIFTIFNRGIGKANIQSIITICRELNIRTKQGLKIITICLSDCRKAQNDHTTL